MSERFQFNNFKEYEHANRYMEFNRIEFVELEEDHCILRHIPDENSLNINGLIHGGLLATMMDVAAATMVRKSGNNCSTAGFTVNYLRPGKGTVYAKAEYIKRGKRLNVVHSYCYDESGTLISDAVVTLCLID